ncbi:hypothetical protein Tco_1008512, partial [Tanacetum coccineum]
EERSLINTSFLDEYECSSLALEWEGRDEKKRLDHLKQDLMYQEMEPAASVRNEQRQLLESASAPRNGTAASAPRHGSWNYA